jgi:putative membrane protein
VAIVLRGIHVESQSTLVVLSCIFGFLNATVRMMAPSLGAPARGVSTALFVFIFNGLMLWLCKEFVHGFHLTSEIDGVIAAVILTVVSFVRIQVRMRVKPITRF